MKIHPRYAVVSAARTGISAAIADVVSAHDITYGELFSILAGEMAAWAKYAVRDERHPDSPDTPGDTDD